MVIYQDLYKFKLEIPSKKKAKWTQITIPHQETTCNWYLLRKGNISCLQYSVSDYNNQIHGDAALSVDG